MPYLSNDGVLRGSYLPDKAMPADFQDKIVLVTGTAGDIGRGVSDLFREEGARVFETDVRSQDQSGFTAGDVSDHAFVRQWVSSVLDETGRIDVLINNAGICPRTPMPEVTPEEWDEVIGVNMTGTFFLSQAVIKHMVGRQSGAIISLASLAGQVGGIAAGVHYSATKAAIVCITKTLARFGAAHGVRANAVAPGVIDTAMNEAVTDEQIEQFRKTIPLGRLGTVAEVIEPILFLASDRASYITGATLDINGGIIMN